MTGQPEASDAAGLLRMLYHDAIAAVQPERAMVTALRERSPRDGAHWIISVGKASSGMARGLMSWLREHGREASGGLVIALDDQHIRPILPLGLAVGTHPVPGEESERAAHALGMLIGTIPPDAHLHVAISGGTSALIAAPLDGLKQRDVAELFAALHRSGLPIGVVNAARKRVTRWSAGRLALALSRRPTECWIMSDVPGDEFTDIGSGPCVGDPWTSADVRHQLQRNGVWDALNGRVREAFDGETVFPGDAQLASVTSQLVASNSHARNAARDAARLAGYQAIIAGAITGDAAGAGRALAGEMTATARGTVMIWGGETTVMLGKSAGRGGRCQELALSAARSLRGSNSVLLAAGTDGRDGPTDAAGAIVDGTSWDRITAAGIDPDRALAEHDSGPALASIGALLPRVATGTNVMDLILALTPPA